MKDHPAIDKVLWTTDGSKEYATYKRYNLRVNHTEPSGICLGYVNAEFVAHADNMPKICNVLLRHVDTLERKKK